jgi:hypothetical protein
MFPAWSKPGKPGLGIVTKKDGYFAPRIDVEVRIQQT